jgi:hypothetical protein
MTTTASIPTAHHPLRRHRWLGACLAAGAVGAATLTVAAGRDDPTPPPAPAVMSPAAADRYVDQLRELARVAHDQGLTGLSPVSLRPIDAAGSPSARYADQLRELARVARDQGVTGLSPVSLGPIARG